MKIVFHVNFINDANPCALIVPARSDVQSLRDWSHFVSFSTDIESLRDSKSCASVKDSLSMMVLLFLFDQLKTKLYKRKS